MRPIWRKQLNASDQSPARDSAGTAVKFTVPTIANGKFTSGAIFALGLWQWCFSATRPSPERGPFTNSVTVTLADATQDDNYYTLDSSVPTTIHCGTTNSFVLFNSANVQAVAVKPVFVNSGVASATFLNSSHWHGTGLRGAY